MPVHGGKLLKQRCRWCEDLEIIRTCHDEEWGIPIHDDRKHFEFILMEVMQCGAARNELSDTISKELIVKNQPVEYPESNAP